MFWLTAFRTCDTMSRMENDDDSRFSEDGLGNLLRCVRMWIRLRRGWEGHAEFTVAFPGEPNRMCGIVWIHDRHERCPVPRGYGLFMVCGSAGDLESYVRLAIASDLDLPEDSSLEEIEMYLESVGSEGFA